MSSFNPYDHLGFLTNRVARLMTQSMEASMEDEGLDFPGSCIGILADLWAKDGVNQKELGMSLIKTKSSINKMLTALEEDELITKCDDPFDGRGKKVFLTPKGKKLQKVIEQKGKEMEMRLISKCSQEDINTTKKVLAEMYENLKYETNNHPA